jgi:hypothetical protein
VFSQGRQDRQCDPARDFVSWACWVARSEVSNFLRKETDLGRDSRLTDVSGTVGKGIIA